MVDYEKKQLSSKSNDHSWIIRSDWNKDFKNEMKRDSNFDKNHLISRPTKFLLGFFSIIRKIFERRFRRAHENCAQRSSGSRDVTEVFFSLNLRRFWLLIDEESSMIVKTRKSSENCLVLFFLCAESKKMEMFCFYSRKIVQQKLVSVVFDLILVFEVPLEMNGTNFFLGR